MFSRPRPTAWTTKVVQRDERLPVAVHDRAAVDVQGLARHITRRRGSQEIDGPCDLLGAGKASEWDQARHLRLVEQPRGDRPLHPLGHRVPRSDRVDTDSCVGPLDGKDMRQTLDPALAALYDSRFGMPTLAAIDEMLTIAAEADSVSAG